MENIAVNVRKVGGFPVVEYTSDRLSKRMFFDVPEKYDSQQNGLGMKLAGIVNVTIDVTNGLTENLLEGADPKRQAARGKANEPVGKEFLKHNVRAVEVGNGFYPTSWRAKRFEMSEDELAKTFWEGVNIDYASLQTRGEQVKTALAAGNELGITNPNGTDLKVRVQGASRPRQRRHHLAGGLAEGRPRRLGLSPGGRGLHDARRRNRRGQGRPHARLLSRQADRQPDAHLRGGGKLVSMEGSGPGYADLRAEYDAVDDERKDLFGFVDLGINPNELPSASKVGAWVPAGTITVGVAAYVAAQDIADS